MDTSDIARTLEGLKQQRNELVEQMERLDQAILGLEILVESYVPSKRAGKARPPRRDAPGTEQAILMVLRDAGRPLHDRQILGALEERGWEPQSENPLNATRAALSRLHRKRLKVVRLDDGSFDLVSRELPSVLVIPRLSGSTAEAS